MELNKIRTTEKPLLKRTDITYRIAYEGATPKRLDLVAAIAAKEKGLVIVRHVYALSGESIALVEASVYRDEAIAKAVEQPKLLAKQRPAAPAEA
jgi:small subunit ribosomal protein S24e